MESAYEKTCCAMFFVDGSMLTLEQFGKDKLKKCRECLNFQTACEAYRCTSEYGKACAQTGGWFFIRKK